LSKFVLWINLYHLWLQSLFHKFGILHWSIVNSLVTHLCHHCI
jgi:hypothetical protein